jgi:hypothetical protein
MDIDTPTLSTIKVTCDGNRHDRQGADVKTESQWADDVKRLLRAEMTWRGITYDELSKKLAQIGVKNTSVNIRNKMARGTFSATFLVQCLSAMGVRSLRLGETEDAG